MSGDTADFVQDAEPKPLGRCPSCEQPIEQVGAEVWHTRSYFPGWHPRDCLPASNGRNGEGS